MLQQLCWQTHGAHTSLCFLESCLGTPWHCHTPWMTNWGWQSPCEWGCACCTLSSQGKNPPWTHHMRPHEPHLNYLAYKTGSVLPCRLGINESSAERLLSWGKRKEKASRSLPIIEAIELVPNIVEQHSQSSGDAVPWFCEAEVSLDPSCTCKDG